jgi:DNA modification methylase
MPRQTDLFDSSNVPQMPEGYYSGDKPNPNLKAFVEAHLKECPYDPETDDYSVSAFDQPIVTTKATAIYNMHTYWSKKPHDAIRQYICHYTQPGDLVLDPFCGSGGSALAALMEGRKAIAIDRSPAATFITKNYCTPVDVKDLQNAFDELKQKVKTEIDWLYETRCEKCDGKARTGYTVYSRIYQCPRCLEKIPLSSCISTKGLTKSGKPKSITICPYCHIKGINEEINSRSKTFGSVPVLVSYSCEKGCKPKRSQRKYNDSNSKKREYFEKYDLEKIREIENKKIPYWHPDADLKEVIPYRMLIKKDFRQTDAERLVDFFTKRNLWALAAIRDALTNIASPESSEAASAIWTAISTVSLTGSKMLREEKRAIQAGTYYLPATFREIRIQNGIDYNVFQLIKAEQEINEIVSSKPNLCISTQSALDLSSISNSSVDYIFTDPPYADKFQYGELNFMWEAWLKFDTDWNKEEVIINEARNRTELDWSSMMKAAFTECYRVLKPGRWLSLCYHDTSEGTWSLVQDIMAEVGFLSDKTASAVFIDVEQKSYNQLMADKVNKRDLVINFRKPKPGEVAADVALTGDEDSTTFNDKVRIIIRDYLIANPGATKDRIYDQVVSRMVRSGQMEAHNFDELLEQVAEVVVEPLMKNLFETQDLDLFGAHEIRRWYLKETEEATIDAAESAKEDAAAKKISRFIDEWLQQHPDEEGVHYSDLFEHYIYTVPTTDKPRRQLQDWLLDYFYKVPSGTYRLPITEEEAEAKTKARDAGTNRRVKRFLSYLEQGLAIPLREMPNDPTLVEWIRHCKRTGLYEQGKLLYEQGGLNLDNLSEELMVDVEEDYQVCVRMLFRRGPAKTTQSKARGKKAKGT